jgi:hypothetical protein
MECKITDHQEPNSKLTQLIFDPIRNSSCTILAYKLRVAYSQLTVPQVVLLYFT